MKFCMHHIAIFLDQKVGDEKNPCYAVLFHLWNARVLKLHVLNMFCCASVRASLFGVVAPGGHYFILGWWLLGAITSFWGGGSWGPSPLSGVVAPGGHHFVLGWWLLGAITSFWGGGSWGPSPLSGVVAPGGHHFVLGWWLLGAITSFWGGGSWEPSPRSSV